MKIIEYEKKYKKDFIELNTAWVQRFFTLEQADLEVLEHVDNLLEKGAMIYFAVEEEKVFATCMAMPLKDDVWEICKLAATGQYTGKGAGSGVFKACMNYAISHGAKKLTLISNRRLKPALHIYQKFGFQEVPLNKAFWGFDRADIEFELVVSGSSDPVTDTIADIKERLAPCGLHCGQCFAFHQGEIHKASLTLQKYLGNFEPYAKRFSVLLHPVFQKYPDFKEFLDYLASSECKGCRKEECKFYSNCRVRHCSAEKQIDFCCQCPDFPCSNTGLDDNLYQRHVAINEKIQKTGAEAYYQEIKDIPRY